jgi:hypothetical protein
MIITSWRSDLQELGRTLEIDDIDEEPAILLFLKSANKEGVMAGGKSDSLFSTGLKTQTNS